MFVERKPDIQPIHPGWTAVRPQSQPPRSSPISQGGALPLKKTVAVQIGCGRGQNAMKGYFRRRSSSSGCLFSSFSFKKWYRNWTHMFRCVWWCRTDWSMTYAFLSCLGIGLSVDTFVAKKFQELIVEEGPLTKSQQLKRHDMIRQI